jgi:hypothetical protein
MQLMHVTVAHSQYNIALCCVLAHCALVVRACAAVAVSVLAAQSVDSWYYC